MIDAILLDSGLDGPALATPCLIGPPRAGKTTYLINLARLHGYAPCLINPAICPPEDVGGIPVVAGRRPPVAAYSQPLIIPPELMTAPRVAVIVDEIDKAPRDHQAALLTLFAERRIRGFELPARWMVWAAMNEPEDDELHEALVERLLYLAFSPRADEIRPTLTGLLRHASLEWYAPRDVRFPRRRITRGTVQYLDNWTTREIWREKAARELIVRGLAPADRTEAILRDLEEVIGALDAGAFLDTAPLQAAIARMAHLIASDARAALIALGRRVDADQTGEWARLLDAVASCPELLALAGPPGQDVPTEALRRGQQALEHLLSKREKTK